MHRIRGQNLFLFILYFLLSFIKHQNAAGVFSPGLRQSCLAVHPAAGTHGQGRILRAVFMMILKICSNSPSLFLSHTRSCSHSRHSCGDTGSCLGIPLSPWWGWETPAQSVLENGPFGTGSASVLTHAPPGAVLGVMERYWD